MGEYGGSFRAERDMVFAEQSFHFLIDGVGDEGDADVSFHASSSIVINGANAQIGFGNAKRSFDLPEFPVVFNDGLA